MDLLLQQNQQLVFYLAHGLLTSKMEIAFLLMMEQDQVGTFFQVLQIVLLVLIYVFFSRS